MFLKWDKVETNSLAFFLHFFFHEKMSDMETEADPKCNLWR